MDSTFNNEEVDETIEWPVPPSSFTSSEVGVHPVIAAPRY